jgi:hypothetical protein
MKQRLLTFIAALFILLFATNCAGIKPFFQVGHVPALTPPHSASITQIKSYNDNYSYVPTSAEENGLINRKNRKSRFSASLPASVKFEF